MSLHKPNDYFQEFLALEVHWCRLVGGPLDVMGMLVEVPKSEFQICIPHLTKQPKFKGIFAPISDETEVVVSKLTYQRNPVNRTQFDFVR